MPKPSQSTRRRLVTVRLVSRPPTSRSIVEPTPTPIVSAKSCSTLTSPSVGSTQGDVAVAGPAAPLSHVSRIALSAGSSSSQVNRIWRFSAQRFRSSTRRATGVPSIVRTRAIATGADCTLRAPWRSSRSARSSQPSAGTLRRNALGASSGSPAASSSCRCPWTTNIVSRTMRPIPRATEAANVPDSGRASAATPYRSQDVRHLGARKRATPRRASAATIRAATAAPTAPTKRTASHSDPAWSAVAPATPAPTATTDSAVASREPGSGSAPRRNTRTGGARSTTRRAGAENAVDTPTPSASPRRNAPGCQIETASTGSAPPRIAGTRSIETSPTAPPIVPATRPSDTAWTTYARSRSRGRAPRHLSTARASRRWVSQARMPWATPTPPTRSDRRATRPR